MPKYSMDTLTAETSYRNAVGNLDNMDDESLIEKSVSVHFPLINELAFDPIEPEHDSLAALVRVQLRHDLRVMYDGQPDPYCDDVLGIGYDQRFPMLSVLYDNDMATDDDEEWRLANPVVRLRHFGLCKKIDPVETVEAANLWANAIQDLRDARAQYANITAAAPIYNIVTTNGTWEIVEEPPIAYRPPNDSERF